MGNIIGQEGTGDGSLSPSRIPPVLRAATGDTAKPWKWGKEAKISPNTFYSSRPREPAVRKNTNMTAVLHEPLRLGNVSQPPPVLGADGLRGKAVSEAP